MKVIIAVVLILLLFSYPVAAGPVDLGVGIVRDGFIAFIKSLGDESYNAAGMNGSQSSVESYVTLATFTFDPFAFPKVQELNYLSGMLAFIFIMLYLGAGAAWAVLCRASPETAMTLSEITDIDRDIAGKAYIQNIALGIFALLLGHLIIRLILILNFVLSGLVAKFTLISNVDMSSNYLLYLFSGLVFLGNVIFFAWRLIVICGIASFSLIIGALLVYNTTRSLAIGVIKYFIGVVFLQLIIIAIIAAGTIALSVISGFDLAIIPFASVLPEFVMVVILLMSMYVSFKICFNPVVKPVTKIGVKAVA